MLIAIYVYTNYVAVQNNDLCDSQQHYESNLYYIQHQPRPDHTSPTELLISMNFKSKLHQLHTACSNTVRTQDKWMF
jgi:hypothetical protein